MLVVTLAKTRAVLAAVSRGASGLPAVEELVGEGLVARMAGKEEVLRVPADSLEVQEVDRTDDVFRGPHAYVVDAGGTLAASSNVLLDITLNAASSTSGREVTVTLSPPATAPGKDVVLLIDAGASSEPLRFVGKTVANGALVKIAVSGVPAGGHLALASADGYNAMLKVLTFS